MKIKHGVTRTAFIFTKITFKIPSLKSSFMNFISGIQANLNEKQFSGWRDDLAKVLYCNRFGLLLIMETCEEIEMDELDFRNKIKKLYANDSDREFMLSDLKKSNWGIKQGRFIKIDFG